MAILALLQASEPAHAAPRAAPAALLLQLPEAEQQAVGTTRAEWNYTFLRGNVQRPVFNADQSRIGTRSQHRKTHLVSWRVKRGLSARDQLELEPVYKAFRQHTHGDGDTHDRNDDGDFERILVAWSRQLLVESWRWPALRVRAGLLLPRRAETEGIGQETGFDLLAASSRRVGDLRVHGAMGFAMSFENRDHPADATFTETPISKGHDLRSLSYGIGATHPLGGRWQAALEVSGRVFDAIELNRRIHESELSVTPGVFLTSAPEAWSWWVGVGVPIGLTSDTDHLGVAIRTGARF